LIAALADTAAGFLERERSYERELAQARVHRELEIAAEIQGRLLTSDVPSLPGVQVAASWRPSREVGGDFFDVQILPDGDRLALALGDVTGKGVPAALLMAMAHGLLRMGFVSTGSPAEAVRLMNSGLADDLSRAGRLLTLFAATFDPASSRLRAVNCGHSPILIYRRGQVELWEADGPPMGILPDVLSVEREQTLESGDALIALSDGFSDVRNADGKRMGVEPLIDAIRRAAGGNGAPSIARALWDLVDEFGNGRTREDDQTMIVVKVE
jgi:sigma-B regulation protein RsbU (phosphoserine phosphatase)